MLKQALKILNQSNAPSKIITRDTTVFKQLLKKIDNPQKSFKSIHITGTNGKGSVTLKTAYILEKAGYKTGIYTSPHIFSFFERIKINRKNIDEFFFSESILKIHEIAQKSQMSLTFFEYLTATGFLYFKHQRCDFASIEVGLGGRYDTTNVITPELSIITSIGIDHEKLLGNTRQQIAKDKAGIIKEGVPVVIGPHANLNPIIQEAKLKNSQLISVTGKFANFDDENNAITRAAIQHLKTAKNLNITDQHIQTGLLIQQPCRMEEIPLNLKPKWASEKRIFFDVGHNPNAIQRMLEYYKSKIQKPGQKLIVVFGSSKDKNVNSSLKKLQEVADIIFFIQPNHPRAMPVNEISEYVGYSNILKINIGILDDGKISSTLMLATAEKKHNNIIICGSFFLMRESWGFFDKKYLEENGSQIQQNYPLKNKDKNETTS